MIVERKKEKKERKEGVPSRADAAEAASLLFYASDYAYGGRVLKITKPFCKI